MVQALILLVALEYLLGLVASLDSELRMALFLMLDLYLFLQVWILLVCMDAILYVARLQQYMLMCNHPCLKTCNFLSLNLLLLWDII